MIFITIVQSHFYLRIFESKIMTLSWIFMAEHISLFGKMATLLNWIMSEPGAVSLVGITSTISTHKSCLKGGEGRRRKKKEIDFFFQFLLRLQIQHHFGKLNFPVRSWEKRHFNEARSLSFFWPFYKLRKREKKTKWSGRIFFLLLIFRLNFDHNSCDGDDGGDWKM